MNKRMLKAARRGNEFQLEWIMSQHFQRRDSKIENDLGIEMQSKLMKKWLVMRRLK